MELILPTKKYWSSFKDCLKDFHDNPTPYDTEAVKKSFDISDFQTYKEKTKQKQFGKNLLEGNVPYTTFWAIQDDTVVGLLNLRHYLTDALKIRGGNIAYNIRPSERRKGYASLCLKLICKYAWDNFNISELLITCHENNTASYGVMKKVMQENGGHKDLDTVSDNHLVKRVWIKTKNSFDK